MNVTNPYAAPQLPGSTPYAAHAPVYAQRQERYGSPVMLGHLTLIALGAYVASGWIAAALDLTHLSDIEAGTVDPALVDLELGVAAVGGLGRIAGIVLFLIWIHRAATNAIALGGWMTTSPGWCVGWFFVPIANLFMPCRAMMQLAGASDPQRAGGAPTRVMFWWAAWLASGLAAGFWKAVSTQGQVGVSTVVQLAATAATTAAFVLLATIVRFINNGQEQFAKAQGASS